MALVTDPQVVQPAPPPATLSPRTLRLIHTGWIVGLAAALTIGVERFGFSPTDQGFILAPAWRILHGEIPHVDIISARPLGSAYLHTVEFLLPTPLLMLGSVFIATTQMIVLTVLLAAWTTGRPVTTWGPLRTGLVATAALVNIHLFPTNAWHTIDGIFLVAFGWWAMWQGLHINRTLLYRAGLFAVGLASLVKQSFVPTILITAATLAVLAARRRRPVRRVAVDAVVLLAAPVAYLITVTAAGGLGAMITQLTGARPTAGQRLIDFALADSPYRDYVLLFGALAVAAFVGPRWLRLLGAGGGCAIVIVVVIKGELFRAGDWGIAIWWMAAVALAVAMIVRRAVPWRPLGLVALGYLACLSWGYDSPTLVAGSLALLTIDVLSKDLQIALPNRLRFATSTTAGLLVIATTGVWFTVLRAEHPYRDQPYDRLTAELSTAVGSMRGIRSTPSTHVYLSQIANCVKRYPASRVAVLPDNPFVYPALRLRNPFPADWVIPLELVTDSRSRLNTTAERLDREGDYLMLFQTVTDVQLTNGAPVPQSVPLATVVVDHAGVAPDLFARLSSGRPVTCGSFVGVWSPLTT